MRPLTRADWLEDEVYVALKQVVVVHCDLFQKFSDGHCELQPLQRVLAKGHDTNTTKVQLDYFPDQPRNESNQCGFKNFLEPNELFPPTQRNKEKSSLRLDH